jgi:hypothetical protein
MAFLRSSTWKVKAVALPLALSFSFLFVLITTAIILDHQNITDQLDLIRQQDQLIRQSKKIEYDILENGNRYKSDTVINLDGPQFLTVITKEHWGIFERFHFNVTHRSKITSGRQNIEKTFLTASLDAGSARIRSNADISICNKSEFSGQCYFNGKIIPGRLEGGPEFSGKIEIAYQSDYSQNADHQRSAKPLEDFELVSLPAPLPDKLTNSFLSRTKYFITQNDLDLRRIVLKGNIIIESEKTLTIDSTCKAQDIILRGKDIIIRHGFKGRLQCFASRSVKVESTVKLEFPSALIADGNKGTIVSLGKHSTLDGMIRAGNGRSNKYENNVILEESATINGSIECDGSVINMEEINGSVDCISIGSIINGQINLAKVSSGRFHMGPYYSLTCDTRHQRRIARLLG